MCAGRRLHRCGFLYRDIPTSRGRHVLAGISGQFAMAASKNASSSSIWLDGRCSGPCRHPRRVGSTGPPGSWRGPGTRGPRRCGSTRRTVFEVPRMRHRGLWALVLALRLAQRPPEVGVEPHAWGHRRADGYSARPQPAWLGPRPSSALATAASHDDAGRRRPSSPSVDRS